jgi:hypothetical protein
VSEDDTVDDFAGRERLDAEWRWIDERGGKDWIATYVQPFYRKWMGRGPRGRGEMVSQIPDVRARAFELGLDEIATMVAMQWRVQVVGTWYAIARDEPGLSDAVHNGFSHCYGTLTAPGLATAVITYPSSRTVDVLRSYRERDITHRQGAADFIGAALRRLGAEEAVDSSTAEDEALAELLDVANQLQRAE